MICGKNTINLKISDEEFASEKGKLGTTQIKE
jgi:hypothetical protein